LINFEKIIGLQVITSDAHTLGEVKGARVDTATWEIKYLNVKLADNAANRLGMKKRFGSPTISIPVSMVQAVAELVTIAKSLEQLEKAKEIVEYKE
jgi:sporulation protein YlmC with PRC-barrel domain